MAARRYLTALFDHQPGHSQPAWKALVDGLSRVKLTALKFPEFTFPDFRIRGLTATGSRRPAPSRNSSVRRSGSEKGPPTRKPAPTPASPADAGWSYTNDATRNSSWRAARRHSRFVSAMRIALPSLAVIVVGWMYFSANRLPTEIGTIDLGDVGLQGTTLTMQNPSMSGFNEDGTAYNVTARKALQDLTNPSVVTLRHVDGTMTEDDGSKVRVTADDGLFDNDKRTLDLDNNIVVTTDDKDQAFLKSARIELEGGTIRSDDAVQAKGKSGSIRANSMEITENGSHLLFKGKVVVHLRLDGGAVSEEDTGPVASAADGTGETGAASDATGDTGRTIEDILNETKPDDGA